MKSLKICHKQLLHKRISLSYKSFGYGGQTLLLFNLISANWSFSYDRQIGRYGNLTRFTHDFIHTNTSYCSVVVISIAGGSRKAIRNQWPIL